MKRPEPIRRAVGLALILASATAAAQSRAPVVEPAAPGGRATNPYLANRAAPAAAEDPMERLNRNLLEMLNRQERLEQELRQLRGDIEMVTHQLDGVKQRQRELYLDVDRRLRELELRGVAASGATAPVPGTEGAGGVPGAVAGAASATAATADVVPAPTGTTAPSGQPVAGEREAYRRAFDLLKEGQYDRAIVAFRGFLERYPAGSYSDNAQYWLGEANYVSRNYPQALEEFGKVLERFPDSPKVPDALLKTGFTHYELGRYDQARKVLQELIQRYPKSTAARLAETRLERMRREGR